MVFFVIYSKHWTKEYFFLPTEHTFRNLSKICQRQKLYSSLQNKCVRLGHSTFCYFCAFYVPLLLEVWCSSCHPLSRVWANESIWGPEISRVAFDVRCYSRGWIHALQSSSRVAFRTGTIGKTRKGRSKQSKNSMETAPRKGSLLCWNILSKRLERAPQVSPNWWKRL